MENRRLDRISEFLIYLKLNCDLELNTGQIQTIFLRDEEFSDEKLEKIKFFLQSLKEDYNIILNKDQLEAVLNDSEFIQIIAGAGTGKTTTLLSKVRYLIEVEDVKSSKILCLSFSRKCADELNKKVNKNISFPEIPVKVATFHELGLDFLKMENRKKRVLDEDNYQLLRSIFEEFIIKKICEEYNRGSFYTFEKLKRFFPHIFNPGFLREKGWEENVLIKNKGDYSYDYNSFKKTRVKSCDDLRIADFLFYNRIEYEYLKEYEFKNEKVQFDFYLPDYDIYIDDQRYDMDGNLYNLNKTESKHYEKQKNIKKQIQYENNEKILIINTFLNKGKYLGLLKKDLISLNVDFYPKELNFKDTKKYLKKNTFLPHLDGLIDYFIDFIKLFKQHNFSENDFSKFNVKKGREKFFIELISDYYSYYQKYLEQKNLADFADMITESMDIIDNLNISYDYILVDEYQDISKIRFKFLKKILEKTKANLIVVGDDWQSIYGFNGCEVKYFSRFEKCFEEKNVEKIFLNKTYRYSQELVDISRKFIDYTDDSLNEIDRLIPKPNLYSDSSLKIPLDFRMYYPRPNKKWGDDTPDKLLYKILDEISNEQPNSSVMILFRYRNQRDEIKKKFNNINASKLFNLDIDFFTIHESKGLERDNIIIFEVNKRSIPNKHNEESLLRFVSFHDGSKKRKKRRDLEERRLFYVALTRTHKKVYLCYQYKKMSSFFKDLPNKDVINKSNFRNNPQYDPLKTDPKSIINNFWKYKKIMKKTDINCPNPDCNGKLIHYNMNKKHFIVCSEFKSNEEKKKLDEGTDYCDFFIDDIIELMDDFYLEECQCCRGPEKGFSYHNTLYNYSEEVKTFCSRESCDCFKENFVNADDTSQDNLDSILFNS